MGSNLGNRLYHMRQALDQIGSQLGECTAVSSLYETRPWGFESAYAFYNAAVCVQTQLAPTVLMAETQAIEQQLGKEPRLGGAYRDRTIDIDIIYFEDWQLCSPELRLPHPKRADRSFVLLPLVEIAADFIDPEWGVSLSQLSEKLRDRSGVVELEGPDWSLLTGAFGE